MDCNLPLTRYHKKERKLWAKSHGMMRTDWNAVIFSDEKMLISTAPMVSRTTGVTRAPRLERPSVDKMVVDRSWFGPHLVRREILR